jgi:hypothetical protein
LKKQERRRAKRSERRLGMAANRPAGAARRFTAIRSDEIS